MVAASRHIASWDLYRQDTSRSGPVGNHRFMVDKNPKGSRKTPAGTDSLAESAGDKAAIPPTVSWPPMDHVFRELESLEQKSGGDLASLLWADDEAKVEAANPGAPDLSLEEAVALEPATLPEEEPDPPRNETPRPGPSSNAGGRAGYFLNGAFEQAAVFLLTAIPQRGDIVTLVAPAGCGKTAMCGFIQTQVPQNVDIAFVPSAGLSATRIFLNVCSLLKVKFAKRPPNSEALLTALIDRIADGHKEGRQAVVIFDEAQDLSPYLLAQIRLLTGLVYQHRYPLRIVLVGRPELNENLAKPEFSEIAQRISGRYRLSPFDAEDTASYVDWRLTGSDFNRHNFDRSARSVICDKACGIAASIDRVLRRCIGDAAVESRQDIDGTMAQRAAAAVGPAGPAKASADAPETGKPRMIDLPRRGTMRRRGH